MRKKALSLALALVMCLGLLPATALAAKINVSNMPNHAVLARLPETLPRPARPTTLEQAYVHVDNVKLGTKWSDESTLREITELVDSLTAGKTTDTQKMKAIFDWVTQNIEYDYVALSYHGLSPWERTDEEAKRAGEAFNVFSAYTNRKAVCDGYTDLCWLMGTIAGIPVAYIDGGAARAAGHHAWNAALVDGKWLFFDATWGEWDMGPNYHGSTSFFVYYDGLYQMTVGNDDISLRLRQGFQDQCPASVTIPSFVTIVDGNAFEGCTNLERVTIPDSVTTIWSGAFTGCTSLKSITIPDSVTEIEGYLFAGCTSLESVTIPNSVTRIWQGTFDGCTSLKSITIPGSVTEMEAAFYGCSALESVTIERGVPSIGFAAFQDCTGLKNVTIPDTVTTIEGQAFWGCTALESITIPNGVKKIEKLAFAECENLKYADLPDSVTDLDPSAFFGCPNLQNMTLPGGLTTIPAYSLRDRTDLTSYDIPAGVTTIGSQAFMNCTNLTSVTIPDSVTFIDNSAFDGCSSLTSVTIPAGLTALNYGVFQGCSSLTSVNIPSGITSIGDAAFARCSGLTSVIIPNGVTTIGDFAFSKCSGLTSITIPNSVVSIGRSFNGCTGLKSIVIPNSVTSIGNWAFDHCTGLESVTIADSVTSIDMWAFAGCTSLTDVYYGGTEEQWKAIQIGDNNEALISATIHYNSAMPQQSQKPQQPAGTKTAAPTNDSLTCNGAAQTPTVYKINDSNYFKIRDLAAILNGTEKQFAVGYDGEKQSVTATTGQGYAKLTGDLTGAPSKSETAQLSNDVIYVDGVKVTAEVYKINGSNYFKLRDLGKALNFYVGWSREQGMYIETDRPYSE